MTESTSAPISSVQNVSNTSASPKRKKQHQQKANHHMVHHIQNIPI